MRKPNNIPKPRDNSAKKPATNKRKMMITQYAERYLAEHHVCKNYAERIRARVRAFTEWLGKDILISTLDCDLVNEFITALQDTDLSSSTINNYRGDLRAVWFDAYELGYNNNPPLRLRRVPKIRDPIEAFTHEEIGKLLVAADEVPDYFRNGVKRSEFWRALILGGYSTGLRRGDILTFHRKLILPSRVATIKQRKTGYNVVVRFSPEAVEAIERIKIKTDERAYPFPHRYEYFGRNFKKLVARAGVRPGTFRWLRRAAGSYAETLAPGGGARLLGHRDPNVFNNHYRDDSIVQEKPIEPPELTAIT